MIKIIGIDPAPTKKNVIFDGNSFKSFNYDELKKYLEELKNEKVLICWDAPLSFSTQKICHNDTPFSKRVIEKFFSQNKGLKTPKGISIMGYSTCPHWIISQYMFGLPKVSKNKINDDLPFKLVFDKTQISKSITEVHPAVAIWLWTNDLNDWEYKKNKETFNNIVKILVNKKIIEDKLKINDDDHLDAYIAWKLGYDWVNNNNQVDVLGNEDTGSFLLPNVMLPENEDVFSKFNNYLKI